MNKLWVLITFLMALGTLTANAQSNEQSQADDPYEWSSKVRATHGLGWFVLAKPLRNYEVLTAFEVSFPEQYTPSLNMKQFQYILKHRSRDISAEYPEADGLLWQGGTEVKVIRYTDDQERHARIANVQTIKGKEVYLWSEALKIHEEAFEVPYDGSLPLTDNFLKEGLTQVVKNAKQMGGDGQDFDALLIKGASVQAIRYLNPGEQN